MKALILICLIMMVATTHALAQDASVDDSLFDALVAARNRNQVVRLFLADDLVSGRVQAIDRTALLIQRRSVRWEEMDSAQVRFVKEDPVWDGAAIGAGVTGLALTVFVGAIARGIGGRRLSNREALGAFMAGGVISMQVFKQPIATYRLGRRTFVQ